ncbi:MAG: glycosyltransferase, partial [Candidatus Lokiarchaeota archaeon]|nr:glycosyltransferase [Candidatus Lokiarchaeota archaeon]
SYITHIHDIGPFQANFSRIPGLKWLEKRNAQKAKLILCGAESVKKEISKYMEVSDEKIRNISCAVDEKYKPDKNVGLKAKKELGLKGPVLYYVGRIAFYKGVEDIIKAYQAAKKVIPELNLVIGGKPTLKMQDKVARWKHEYPEVKFVGLVPDEKMVAYYNMADIFVTYSYAAEGWGMTPVEALSCGTPVICSNMPAYKEVLQDKAIFVEPQQPDLLAQSFVKYIKSEDLRKQVVEESQEFLKRYSWKEVGNRVEKVYQEYLDL